MFSTFVDLATIVEAVPVTVAALLFLFKTVPTFLNTPEGLRLEVSRATGDPGYRVRITNYGSAERHIEMIGVMLAEFRPRRARLTRRISAQENSIESLMSYTIGDKVDITLSSGKSVGVVLPQSDDRKIIVSPHQVKSFSVLLDRYRQW